MGDHVPFPRGDGPLLSCLIPSRGRPSGLLRAIDSMYSLCKDKANIEFALKVDDDDQDTITTTDKLLEMLPHQVRREISPRGNGYVDVHKWVDSLCNLAQGDWFFLFNDDAVLKTQDWDQILLTANAKAIWHGLPEVCLLHAQTMNRPFATEFILLRREVFKILGHWSLSPHCDNWIFTVCRFLGCAYQCPLVVEHFQGYEDETEKDSKAHRAVSAEEFNSIPTIQGRLQDVQTLLWYIQKEWGKK